MNRVFKTRFFKARTAVYLLGLSCVVMDDPGKREDIALCIEQIKQAFEKIERIVNAAKPEVETLPRSG